MSASASPTAPAGPSLRFGRFVFRYRDYIAPAVLLVLLLGTRPASFLGPGLRGGVVDAIGILVASLGQLVRVTVIGLAYIKRGGRNKTITADRLVCEGVFAHSRNPMYVGNLLLITGLLIVWSSPVALAIVLPIALIAFLSIVEAEETFLRQRFGGEFEEYCRRVPRFLPDLRGFGTTLSQFEFDWRRVLRKEYGTTFSWISAVLALLAVKAVHWHGVAGSEATLRVLAGAWLAVGFCWATVRWLKKTHRLDSPD